MIHKHFLHQPHPLLYASGQRALVGCGGTEDVGGVGDGAVGVGGVGVGVRCGVREATSGCGASARAPSQVWRAMAS